MLFNSFLHYMDGGLSLPLTSTLRKKIWVSNRFALGLGSTLPLYTPYLLYNGFSVLGWCLLPLAFFFLLVPELNRRGFIYISRLLMVIFGNLSIAIYVVVLEFQSGMYLWAFVSFNYTLIFFAFNEKKYIGLGYFFTTILISSSYLYVLFNSENSQITYGTALFYRLQIIMFFSSLFTIFILLWFFFKGNHEQESKLFNLNEELTQLKNELEDRVEIRSRELSASEEKFRDLYESAPVAYFNISKEGIVKRCNKSAENLFGRTKEELYGKSVISFGAETSFGYSKIQFILEKFRNQQEIKDEEVQIKKKDGEVRWINLNVNINQNNEDGIFESRSIAIDITDKKKNEEEMAQWSLELERKVKERTQKLENANSELLTQQKIMQGYNEKLNTTLKKLQIAQSHLVKTEKMASLGVLTKGISHEFNNPLNYINGSTLALEALVNKGKIEKDPTFIKLIENIKIGANKCISITKSLQQLSRQNDEMSPISNLHKIIDNCLLLLHNNIKNVALTKNYTDKEYLILGNENKLHQAFINILNNAVQAQGEVCTIHITTILIKESIKIEIKDYGCGIDPLNIDKVTDPFYTTKEPGKGVGLGLSIVYETIKQHKGTIKFDSKLDVGTTVSIDFPLYSFKKEINNRLVTLLK